MIAIMSQEAVVSRQSPNVQGGRVARSVAVVAPTTMILTELAARTLVSRSAPPPPPPPPPTTPLRVWGNRICRTTHCHELWLFDCSCKNLGTIMRFLSVLSIQHTQRSPFSVFFFFSLFPPSRCLSLPPPCPPPPSPESSVFSFSLLLPDAPPPPPPTPISFSLSDCLSH